MTSKPLCKYGVGCYRKNAQHLSDFRHGRDDEKTADEKVIEFENESESSLKDTDSEATLIEDDSNDPSATRGKKRRPDTSPPAMRKRRSEDSAGKKGTLDSFFGGQRKSKTFSAGDKLEEKSPVKTPEKPFHDLSDSDDADLLAAAANVEESVQVQPDDGAQLNVKEGRKKINDLYQVEMPEDFFHFWEFCQTLNKEKPADGLKSAGLRLVGPYDILSGKVSRKPHPNYLLHWRYYYDPPEFTTLIAEIPGNAQFHMGYFRDDPKDVPVFVASNAAGENCNINARGRNIFTAVKWYLEDKQKKTKEKGLGKLLTQLCDYAKDKKILLDYQTPGIKARQKKVVSRTFHGAGLVVPVDANDVGYRPVPETPGDLKKMLKRIVEAETEEARDSHLEPLEEIITYVQFANDECDYGEGIELGLDLFSYGGQELHSFVNSLLTMGYKLVKRDLYGDIMKAFLPVRRKDRPFNALT